MTNEIPEGDRDNLCLKRPNLSVKHASAIINLKRATTAKESNENVEKRLCVQRGKRSNLLLSNRIRSPRPPPKMEKANKSSWAPVGEGGYLDGVDDEAGEEEEQAEGEHD